MKLWQAILEGSKGTQQAFGVFSDGENGYCAAGAACRSLSGAVFDPEGLLRRAYKICMAKALCPECKNINKSLILTIFHLNDQHKWTREAIAGWVRSIEDPSARTVDAVKEEPVLEYAIS